MHPWKTYTVIIDENEGFLWCSDWNPQIVPNFQLLEFGLPIFGQIIIIFECFPCNFKVRSTNTLDVLIDLKLVPQLWPSQLNKKNIWMEGNPWVQSTWCWRSWWGQQDPGRETRELASCLSCSTAHAMLGSIGARRTTATKGVRWRSWMAGTKKPFNPGFESCWQSLWH